MTAQSVDADQRLMTAIAHPLRTRVLLALGETVSSPKRLAGELGEPLGRVSHHVRVLARIGAIELVETRRRRGAVEHFYKATIHPVLDDTHWAKLPRSMRRALFAEGLARALEDVSRAASAGGFAHRRAAVTYEPLDLDREGFEAVADILASTALRVLAARSSYELGVADEDVPTTGTELAMLHFMRA